MQGPEGREDFFSLLGAPAELDLTIVEQLFFLSVARILDLSSVRPA
jgi:hypothetical protein